MSFFVIYTIENGRLGKPLDMAFHKYENAVSKVRELEEETGKAYTVMSVIRKKNRVPAFQD